MLALFRFLLLVTALLAQGCQILHSYPYYKVEKRETEKVAETETDRSHDQIHSLLQLGKQYRKLSKEGLPDACKQLELDYLHQKDWQSAWLLVYLLNEDFNCVNQTKTLKLLKAIQSDKEFSTYLKWLNHNQIVLITKLISLQTKNNNFKKKNNALATQLNEAETQLQDVISKIQALKVIETTINQKTE
jgi:hypothetical protein